jgi:hypothetical protein
MGNGYFSHVIEINGGARRDRTDDLVNAIQVLPSNMVDHKPTNNIR